MALSWVAALIGCLAMGFAAIAQAVAARRVEGPQLVAHPWYIVGMALDVVGWCLSVVALRHLPLLVVQTILPERWRAGTTPSPLPAWLWVVEVIVPSIVGVVVLGDQVQHGRALLVQSRWRRPSPQLWCCRGRPARSTEFPQDRAWRIATR